MDKSSGTHPETLAIVKRIICLLQTEKYGDKGVLFHAARPQQELVWKGIHPVGGKSYQDGIYEWEKYELWAPPIEEVE